LLSLSAARFAQPIDTVQPTSTAGLVRMTPEARQAMQRACQDCHSDKTRWPWYSHLAPVSWLVRKDVEEGRKFLNFSRWESYSPTGRMAYLASIASAAKSESMPPKAYLAMHPDARLSAEDREAVVQWARQEYRQLRQEMKSAAAGTPQSRSGLQ
jgi:hypothetical protein